MILSKLNSVSPCVYPPISLAAYAAGDGGGDADDV